MPPDCQRCGTELNSFGRCQDECCPFSECAQDDSGGWEGHPHYPDPVGDKIVDIMTDMRGNTNAEVSQAIADAFNMNGLPNVTVQPTPSSAEEQDDAREALETASADCDWKRGGEIETLLAFIALHGLSTQFADYVNTKADKECEA